MKVNYSKIEGRFEELVNYDGYLPCLLRPLGFPMRDFYDNLKEKGLYDSVREKELRTRNYTFQEEMKELEDFIKENPQFKEFITYDVSDNIGPVDDSHPWVDEVYSNLIGEELVGLDDFVPPMYIPASMVQRRNLWIKETGNEDIVRCNRAYKRELFLLEGDDERTIYIMQCMIDFIEDYPQYSGLIKDIDGFKRHLWKLKMGVHMDDND